MNNNCPICGRQLINGPSVDDHHLIPKCKKGTDTVTIHKICHSKIHSVWTEKELTDYYHTVERIKSHIEIQKFIKWVSKKAPEYYVKTRDTLARKRKRRR